ncbi:hypothetical protein ACSTS3_14585 [Aquimarina muelleri]|uniref:hypothetical protein n=1 Tax=Aquimarina muelleri TaxID=279356 RepID=UPI003F687D9B
MTWTKGWTSFDPNNQEYPEPEKILPNIIDSDLYLKNDTTYLLSGNVYVINNATLTIQEGTTIRCNVENVASLVVTKGAKLLAKGTKGFPIVFTSNKPKKNRKSGDWGGIIIAGAGKVNSISGSGIIEGDLNPIYSVYGGNQVDEETTILRHVRIEFPGNISKNGIASNGLSLYGIGTSSIIEDIMVSYSGNDSYNIRGGKNNISKLISFKAQGDDYQITEGFKGNLNNILAIRHPYINSPQGSYALKLDGFNLNYAIGFKLLLFLLIITSFRLYFKFHPYG